MVAFTRGTYVRWRPADGTPAVLIDAVHAAGPKADAHTGAIAETAAKQLGTHCIVALVSRLRADLNRPRTHTNAAAIDEYRAALHGFLDEADLLLPNGQLRQPLLHLAVHGMNNKHGYDVEVGTRHGQTCTPSVQHLVVDTLNAWAGARWARRRPLVAVNQQLIGDPSKIVHRAGHAGSAYAGYGPNFNTVQLEFATWLRKGHRARIVQALVEITRCFQASTDARLAPKKVSGGIPRLRRRVKPR